MALNITTARDWIRDYARNAGDVTDYLPARIDRALQYIGGEFVRFSRCTRQTNSATLAINTAGFSTTGSGFTNFRPEYLIGDPKLWVVSGTTFVAEVEVVSLAEIYDLQLNHAQTAAPQTGLSKAAFTLNYASGSGGLIYPTPDAGYSLYFMWSPPFSAWTPGTTPTPDSFNIPDEYLQPLLTLFVPRALQHNEPEHIYAADRDAEFMAYCQRCSGMGNLGVTSIKRESVCDRRRGWW